MKDYKKLKYHKNDLDRTIKELVDFVVEELNAAKESGEALGKGFTICTFTASSQFYRDYWYMLDKFQAEFDSRVGRNIDLDWYVVDIPCRRRHYRALFGVDLFTNALLEEDQEEFRNEVKDYCETFDSYLPVLNALQHSSEEDVKKELCKYIDEEWGGNSLIKDYIRSVSWK